MPRSSSARLAACVLWVLCGLYASQFAFRGWVPHDEGTIAQSAERVLGGEVPHRDFDDVYTGGLTYLHAAGMKIAGVNLRAPRLVLFTFFMAFLAAVYAIGRRVASRPAAAVAMLLSTVWTVPNYFASLPSWYNLFFATFGVLAFLRYLESPRRRWLTIAGACGGLSVLAKISGVYFLAGGVVFLTYVEQAAAQRPLAGRSGRGRFWMLLAAGALAVLGLLLNLLLSRPLNVEVFELFAPVAAVCAFVVLRERETGAGAVADRCRRLSIILWPFVAGAAVPVLAFGLFYWTQHGVADLIRGVFVLPQRRLVDPVEAGMVPPSAATLGLAVPYLALLVLGRRGAIPKTPFVPAAVTVLLATALAFGARAVVYSAAWAMFRSLPVVAVGVSLWTLAAPLEPPPKASAKRAQVFLLAAMAAMVALIQFPFAAPIYFCYAAPIAILTFVALVSGEAPAAKRLHLCVAAFVLLFAAIFMNRSYVWTLGFASTPYRADSRLDIDRGGLFVPDEDKATYEAVVRLVRQHAAGGTIYAGPDCPEVYFLSGFPNPTRALFDFLASPRQDAPWVAELLATRPIRAAVINTDPNFSPPLDAAVQALLERRFPSSQQVGRFLVRFE